MNFIDAIKKFQEAGDRGIFGMIREAMSYDYLRSPAGMAFGKPEMYVAFRCLRLIGGRLATIKYTLAEHGLHTRRDTPEYIFSEFAITIEEWTGIKLTVENFPKHEKYLAGYLPTFYELRRAYERIIGARPTLWQLLTEEVVNENWPALQAALEYALNRVDTCRSEREVVRYINRATKTAYYRNQFDGMRRVRRGGETRYVTPRYYGPLYALFGRANPGMNHLSSRQRALVGRICAIIEEDFAGGRTEEYAVDLRGGYRIKNRHIAGRLGMHEASLSRALRGIRTAKH